MTLSDAGRAIAVHKRLYGTAGIDVPQWLQRHFPGRLFQLGRLQFEQVTLGKRTSAAMGAPFAAGDPVLSIHIPEYTGPLTPAAVDASLTWARRFFKTHFPQLRYQAAVCHSWLLDPQLTQYLPAGSNIAHFVGRFRLAKTDQNDEAPLRFAFQGTALRRVVDEHLAAGGHWQSGSGWLCW
jgi:hypothetical protein